MKIIHIQHNKGFTLIETMIAVFVLTAAMAGFFSLLASSLFSARYARNEITANYLLQEAVDYVRNDRDTVAFQQSTNGGGWINFLNRYGYNGGVGSDTCFTTTTNFNSAPGCYFEPALSVSLTSPLDAIPVKACTTSADFGTIQCPVFNYDQSGAIHNDYYTYDSTHNLPATKFKRQVVMLVNPTSAGDELAMKVTVEWQNGGLTRSKSLVISLLNWQK